MEVPAHYLSEVRLNLDRGYFNPAKRKAKKAQFPINGG